MQNKNIAAKLRVWLIVLILFAGVAATTVALIDRLDVFQFDDSGAMPLIPEGYSIDQINTNTKKPAPAGGVSDKVNNPAENIGTTGNASDTNENNAPSKRAKPGFQVEDNKVIWNNNTQVEIFRVSYENDQQTITVISDNGEEVIAPGTENSYTFKLSNTGDVALDYEVTVEAYFTPEDVVIPVTARLYRYDGEWIVGGSEDFADVPTLNGSSDGATLGAGRYTYYTLDWQWPFESGDDAYDTMLGDRAVGEDLVFTIVISTRAEYSDNPDDDGGIVPTGDNSYASIMTAIAIGSFAMFIILLVLKIKDKRDGSPEGEKH